MDYWELRLEQVKPTKNPLTGRFLPGSIPHNKGKKWSEYMTKDAQRRAAKGWANLDKYRHKKRPDTSERFCKGIVAVMENGEYLTFKYSVDAAEWIQGNRENIGRCCRANASNHVNAKTGQINTDHNYKGVRFYYITDTNWLSKVD